MTRVATRRSVGEDNVGRREPPLVAPPSVDAGHFEVRLPAAGTEDDGSGDAVLVDAEA